MSARRDVYTDWEPDGFVEFETGCWRLALGVVFIWNELQRGAGLLIGPATVGLEWRREYAALGSAMRERIIR